MHYENYEFMILILIQRLRTSQQQQPQENAQVELAVTQVRSHQSISCISKYGNHNQTSIFYEYISSALASATHRTLVSSSLRDATDACERAIAGTRIQEGIGIGRTAVLSCPLSCARARNTDNCEL